MKNGRLNAPLRYYFRMCGRVFPAQSLAEFMDGQQIWESQIHGIQACPVGSTSWQPLAGLPEYHASKCRQPSSSPTTAAPVARFEPAPFPMRTFCLGLMLTASIILGIGTLTMDTAVPSSIGPVHNLARAHDQLIYALLCATAFLTSVIGLCLPRK